MNLVVGVLLGIAGSVLISLVVADVRSWLVKGARLLVLLAAQLLPERHRARYGEEWQANLIAIEDSPLSLVALALWTAARAPRWASRLRRIEENESKNEDVEADPISIDFGTLNPYYTFERFVIGPGNRLAYAASLAVAEAPSEAYNPLFLHGLPGMGKTHLLGAIGNYLRENDPHLSVRFTTAEEFTNEFVASLKASGIDAFKARYRELDVLLIDDVQFLQGKPATEEEFFHTFNALYESGSQIVLSADRIPRELSTLAARLRDRFDWGLTVPMEPPSLVTRTRILERLVEEAGVEINDPGALSELAIRIDANVRQLRGAFTRVLAHSVLMARPLTSDLIVEVIPTRSKQNSVEEIKMRVAEHFHISEAELIGASRASAPIRARQVAIYLTRDLTDLSLPQIGRLFGGRNHSTVLNSIRRIEALMGEDANLADQVKRLRKTLRENG